MTVQNMKRIPTKCDFSTWTRNSLYITNAECFLHGILFHRLQHFRALQKKIVI